MDDNLIALEKEYCPPVDTATFHAIVLDFDLGSTSGRADARSTLDAIKLGAELEEATGFDPSGSSAPNHGLTAQLCHDEASSHQDGSMSKSTATDLTSNTDSIGSRNAESSYQTSLEREIENLSTEDKQALLVETFPNIPVFTVSHALKRCQGNFERAVEELLTTGFLEEGNHSDGEQYRIPRGIDGFAQSASSGGSSKSKRRRRRKVDLGFGSASTPGSSESLPLTTNKWDKSSREIEYVAQRVSVPKATVTSLFHQQSASLSKTIQALANDTTLLQSIPSPNDPSIIIEIPTLVSDFPTIDIDTLTAILRMTHPSTAAAHELALAMIKSPFPAFREDQSVTSLLPQYSSLKIDDGLQSDSSPALKTRTQRQLLGTLPARDLTSTANSYAAARQQAFDKASAAYRRSRSDRLMGGVAAYYGSIGRDATAMVHAYSAEAADTLVAGQSTSTKIDLHGVDVKNAVRISLESTERWWNGGAAEYAREGKVIGGGGFSIVTGIGRHSQSGKGRLGPAVKKALTEGGWRVEDTSGVLLVRGKGRR